MDGTMTARCIDCQISPTTPRSPRCAECGATYWRSVKAARRRRLTAKRRAAEEWIDPAPWAPMAICAGDQVLDVLDIKARGGAAERQLWAVVGRAFQMRAIWDYRAEFPDRLDAGSPFRYGRTVRTVIAHAGGGVTLLPTAPEALQ